MDRRKSLRYAAAVTLVAAGTVALPLSQALAAEGTTVTPAGHQYAGTLVAGTTATFLVSTTTVTCDTSAIGGTVPAEPGNTAPGGPVVSELTPATFSTGGGGCPTSVPSTTAVTTGNATNGPWTLGLQYGVDGSTGTMTVPRAGVITQISGLASCTVTVAPDGPASITGPLLAGDGENLPRLDLSAGVSLPIRVTGGFFCPTDATTATFRATYDIADLTDPLQRITVGPAVPPVDPSPSDEPTSPPA